MMVILDSIDGHYMFKDDTSDSWVARVRFNGGKALEFKIPMSAVPNASATNRVLAEVAAALILLQDAQ